MLGPIGRLGKRPARRDPRTLRLARYLKAGLPAPPATIAPQDLTWGMMKNDALGDCTIAAAGHMEMSWTAAAGSPFTPTDGAIVKAYMDVSGYSPCIGASTDRGAVELDVLNYWRQTGIAGRQITAYGVVNPLDHYDVRQCAFIFEGLYIGLNLPSSAQDQDVWDVTPGMAPGSWGGHAVPVVGYDVDTLTVVTWGALQKMTWAFWDLVCDEVYAIVSADQLAQSGTSPLGFNLSALLADLAAATQAQP